VAKNVLKRHGPTARAHVVFFEIVDDDELGDTAGRFCAINGGTWPYSPVDDPPWRGQHHGWDRAITSSPALNQSRSSKRARHACLIVRRPGEAGKVPEKKMKTASPKCPTCLSDKFELRLLRDEALASARCVTCSADYLLLDSNEYWFDVIQKGYPRVTRCSCKNESFRLRIDYNIRDDGDVDYIEIHSICSACGKTRRQLDFEVDYCGTDHLLKKPLVPCRNPKVLYDLKELNLLLTLPDIVRIVDHLAKEKCEFLSNLRDGDTWVPVRQDAAEAKATIEERKYLFIYAMPKTIEVPEDHVNATRKENAFWKRSEVIRIGSKSHVCRHQSGDFPPGICYCSYPPTHASYTEIGLSFEIEFSNEFVHGEKIVPKSEGFRKVTASLLAMLATDFVSWRGAHCFDNPEVNLRVFGDRFQKKSKSKGNR
jgi:hypothetical protein